MSCGNYKRLILALLILAPADVLANGVCLVCPPGYSCEGGTARPLLKTGNNAIANQGDLAGKTASATGWIDVAKNGSYWYINGANTGVEHKGPQGAPGPQGATGATGQNGDTGPTGYTCSGNPPDDQCITGSKTRTCVCQSNGTYSCTCS